MKKILFGAMSVFLLTACSQDDVEMVNNANDAIKFTAVANNASRAGTVYCNKELPKEFKVWAKVGSTDYILGDVFSQQTSAWESTQKHYWPEKGTAVNFFAVNAEGYDEFNWNSGAPKIENFKVSTDVTAQEDLIYAVTTASRPDAAGTATPINFRHALSQVVFKAQNTNKNIHVKINKVTVCKVMEQGTYTYNTAVTDNNIDLHANATSEYYKETRGTWGPVSGLQNFATTAINKDLEIGVVENLTYADDVDQEDNVLMLIPQYTPAWIPGIVPANQNGSYFLVDCTITNIADGTGVKKETDTIVVWNGETAIPFNASWEEGKKYVYTFIFDGQTTGGYDPEDGKTPALFPISFNVTVDDFVDGGNTNIDMK